VKKNKVLTAVLVVIILVAAYVTYKRTRPPARTEADYPYSVYAVDEDGHYYLLRVSGKGLEFPVEYHGKQLKALYACGDCKHRFAKEPRQVVASCPECGSPNAGGYDPAVHGEIEAETVTIDLRNPSP